MAIKLRPTGDISTNSWTVPPLYSKINEVVADDSNYAISSRSPSLDTFEINLSGIGTPITKDNHNIQYRIQKTNTSTGQLDLTVSLFQGSTPIASGVHTDILTGFYTTGFNLTLAQANNITDYSALSLRFTANLTSGNFLVDESSNLFIDEFGSNLTG